MGQDYRPETKREKAVDIMWSNISPIMQRRYEEAMERKKRK